MARLQYLYLRRVATVCIALALAASCETLPNRGSTDVKQSVSSVKLAPLAGRLRDECMRIRILSPRCPQEVPSTDTQYSVRELDFGTSSYRVVEYAANAPYPTIGRRNSPPRFAHVVLKGGDLTKAFPFDWPSIGQAVALADALNADRDMPVSLGNFSWGGYKGTLVLAPAFPLGGVDGDHVVYRWGEPDKEYSLSLHAWQPLEECVATLRTLVESATGR